MPNQFIEWDSQNYDCPVPPNTCVEVIDAAGVRRTGPASKWYWFYQGWPTDVARYRVIS